MVIVIRRRGVHAVEMVMTQLQVELFDLPRKIRNTNTCIDHDHK